MSGEEGGGTVDAGAEGAGDTGVDESTSVGTEGAGEGTEGGEAKLETAAEKRYRIRLFGKEREHTADEMAKMLDDDYEWNFHGVSGKPLLQDGKPLTRKFKDLARDVQMSKGAADAARRANEERKSFEQRIQWGKEPENRIAFMRDVMGVEDANTWALQLAAQAFNRRTELAKLAQTDPVAHQRELEQDFRKEQEALQKSREARQQREQGERQRAENEQRFYGTVTEHLGKVGVPLNARTREMVDQVCRDYSEAGAELSFEDLSGIVRDLWHEEIFGYLDPKNDEELLKLFGDKRRERLRKAEIAAMKGAKKAAVEPPKPKPAASNGSNGRKDSGGMTAEQFMRASRNGGRV